MGEQIAPVPVAHIDDEQSTIELTQSLSEIHGRSYAFAIDQWEGRTALDAKQNRVGYHVVIEARDSSVTVAPEDVVRGRPPDGPYVQPSDQFAQATESHEMDIWPGDVITVRPGDDPVELSGTGTFFAVHTEHTPYPAPRFCFLRYIPDERGGCAAYENAFRREVLPPIFSSGGNDVRGRNRVNQHTIDMRYDREPAPVHHCHAPVPIGDGQHVAHTETAIILDRSTYNRPPVETSEQHVRIFRQPHNDAADWIDLSVEPGTIVVTPATETALFGHCFHNAFAALVAVPSFTAPLIEVGDDSTRSGQTHRKYHQ